MADNPFAQFGITDPDAIAYLNRYPDVAAVVPQYGPNTAQLHYDKWGRAAGLQWGQDQAPAQAVQETPVSAGPSIYGNDPENWNAYREQARAGTEGINRMPFVFSGFPTIPRDEKAAMALFYPGASAAPAAQAPQNPLLAGPQMSEQEKINRMYQQRNGFAPGVGASYTPGGTR